MLARRGRLIRALEDAFRPPLADRRFWAMQLAIVAVVVLHQLHHLKVAVPAIGIPHFASLALLLLPVVYAALTWGFGGAVATAGWTTLLALPFVLPEAWHPRLEDLVQLTVVDVAGFLVSHRVERERTATAAYRSAEKRYRVLFEGNQAPILVTDLGGTVRELNGAAAALFGGSAAGRPLADLLGRQAADCVIRLEPAPVFDYRSGSGARLSLRPASTEVAGPNGRWLLVVIHDVTQERVERDRIQSYAVQVLRGHEEERRRLAHELHDDPLQTLLYLSRRLRADARAAPQPTAAVLEETRNLVEGLARDLRRIAEGLRPPSLDDLGLVAALRQALAEVAQRAEVDTMLHVDGEERRLAPEVELGLFRIAQEALRNVERHAHASCACLDIRFEWAGVSVTVSDDGVGIENLDGEGRGAFQSLGMNGMRERAALLGGRFQVTSEPGTGTRIEFSVPTPDPGERQRRDEESNPQALARSDS